MRAPIMRIFRGVTPVLVLFWCACTGQPNTPQDAGTNGLDAGTTGAPDAGGPTLLADETWCDHVAVGPGPSLALPVALSRAHAWARYFGPLQSVTQANDACVDALLATHNAVEDATLAHLAALLPGVCRVPVVAQPLGQANVERMGDTAVVHPGTGPVVIPADVASVVLDLRDIAQVDGVEDALERAVTAVTSGVVPGLEVTQVLRTGLTDEAFFQGLYQVELHHSVQPDVVGTLPQARPLAVVVGERVAPAAARWAARLRVQQKAWLVGSPLHASTAESRVLVDPAAAMVVRTAELRHQGTVLMDVLPADEPNVMQLGAVLARGTNVPPLVMAPPQREPLQANEDFGAIQDGEADVAHARAALVAMHGAMNLFFPYFDVLGNMSDARLEETLALAGQVTSRFEMREVIRRMGNVTQDGHGWTTDNVEDLVPRRMFNVFLDDAADFPVVARSYATGFAAGDTLLELDGVPANTWLLGELGRAYGATDGSRRFNALQELTLQKIPAMVRVRNAAGVERDQVVTPSQPRGDLFAGSTRRHGPLTDLGRPDLFYMNLDGAYVGNDGDVNNALTQAAGATALLLDMRGHPASRGGQWDPYSFLMRLMSMSFETPRYRVPVLVGGDHVEDIHPYEATYDPLSDVTFHGPVVFITDRMSVSFAEDFAMMLLGANRAAAVVGRPTAGTTGSVTGMQLPAGFAFFMTGMEARWPDGSTFFGRGAIPTVDVVPTAQDYAQGVDPFLRAAMAAAP